MEGQPDDLPWQYRYPAFVTGRVTSPIAREMIASMFYFGFLNNLFRKPQFVQRESKNPPEIFWHFFPNGWEFSVQILRAYYTFLSTLDYKFLFNYLQLWRSYAVLSATTTTIMCSKCPPSTETHAEWSHLIWHNFVKVAVNWIKIPSLA